MTRNLRVFVDSNVLLSAARGGHSDFQEFWILPGVDVLTSSYSINEVSRNLKAAHDRARLWNLIYRSHLVPDGAGIHLPEGIQLAAKDLPILQSAVAGEADVLVTGDRNHFEMHYGSLILGVRIESPRMFKSRYPQRFPSVEAQ